MGFYVGMQRTLRLMKSGRFWCSLIASLSSALGCVTVSIHFNPFSVFPPVLQSTSLTKVESLFFFPSRFPSSIKIDLGTTLIKKFYFPFRSFIGLKSSLPIYDCNLFCFVSCMTLYTSIVNLVYFPFFLVQSDTGRS